MCLNWVKYIEIPITYCISHCSVYYDKALPYLKEFIQEQTSNKSSKTNQIDHVITDLDDTGKTQ